HQTEHLSAGGAIRRAHLGLEVHLRGDACQLPDAVLTRLEAVGSSAGVVDWPRRSGALHSLFQLRAHREASLLVAAQIAHDVYEPDPTARASNGWRAASWAAMDYRAVKEI